jgi:hypothetical protein
MPGSNRIKTVAYKCCTIPAKLAVQHTYVLDTYLAFNRASAESQRWEPVLRAAESHALSLALGSQRQFQRRLSALLQMQYPGDNSACNHFVADLIVRTQHDDTCMYYEWQQRTACICTWCVLYVWPQFTYPKRGANSLRLLVPEPTNFKIALTSLMSELVNATLKFVMAPLQVGPEFAANF